MIIRVIAVEDHPLMLKAIVDELSSDPDIQVVGELTTAWSWPGWCARKTPTC